uniref:uncharacterized protein LOC122580047 isoform X2 n=1 Tax=Erigeron canadensis TaxID=72917 RepID=UPI001CB90410|nr:uncharacterized protein LOC122580047 isoform X2 [Erigeron canadensis]
MWPVLSESCSSVAAAAHSNSSFHFIDTNSFSKDGRKINVGDCALFTALHSSLPFVGIIRKLIVGKENSPSLSVTWLYRPADVKLREGAPLEAAPNEIFYSFHKDEIPAASILHPCKVTFLRKGVEFPSGISSFVCRRVYDIEGECLWWLTDKDYIKERQQEVNQLLDKARIAMYGSMQNGGRSPKPLNGPNGTSQLKPSSDNVQNSSSSISSHAKSKKREHGAHNSDSVKRERLSKVDDADSGQRRPDHIMKTEIAKFTDKGGLVDFGGVERLIQLMRPDSSEKKLDLASRTVLVDLISVTDRFDCLNRFVQLRGLSVLDEWLQEIHKGKIGDGSPKVNEKSVEEFLFSLLRALDRLPVNLHALQTCNVGKSVNHLRSHKNSEIQKKARSLVSTWKRRVEAEMNIIETKSSTSRGGSWPNKSMMSEVSHMGSRRTGCSSEVDPKSSTSQPSSLKSQQPKHASNEAATKSPTSPASIKLSDMPSSATKDGRSCSSSQSPNNSQSCSSDHGKTGASSVSKISSSVSHSKNSSNGFHGSTTPGVRKDAGKSGSLNRNYASEKGSPTRHTSERASDVSHVDNGNSPRLIVRLPNSSRSPARTVSVESPEEGSLLVPSEKQVHYDEKVRGNNGSLHGNNESNLGRDLSQGKDGLVGCGSSSGVTPKPGKLYEPSYSSINALVESCAKFSEASVSPSVGDDVGMNLLASVAAGEMSRSDVSAGCSPRSNSPLPEDSCSVNVAKLRRIVQDEDNICMANGLSVDSSTKDRSLQQAPAGVHISGDSKDASFGCEVKTGEDNTQLVSPVEDNAAVMEPERKDAGLIEDAKCSKEGDGCPDVKQTQDNVVAPDTASRSVKIETQVNEESASWSSSDMHEDKKKLAYKRSSNSNLATPSCGDADLVPKLEELDDKERHIMDSGTSISQPSSENALENNEKDEAQDPPTILMQEVRSCGIPNNVAEANCAEDPCTSAVEMVVKLDFDLNEVLPNDDGIQGDAERSSVHPSSPIPSSSLVNGSRSALITVAAAAKGPFYPSENLLKGKAELGWKGSAATSAFRPAEPRKVDVPAPDNRKARPLFDFDLNVGVVDDAGQSSAPSTCLESSNRSLSGGGLDLDLNACEESPEVVRLSVSSGCRQQLPSRSFLSGGFTISEPSSSRGFDLNNGPVVEEAGGESVLFSKNGMQFMSAVPNVRMNNMDIGNYPTWFSPNNTYPAITIPSVAPGRGEQSYPSQRMLNPVTAGTSVNPEIFRGPVLSSSPAVTFPSTVPFQYSAFPFETSFSLPSVSNAYVDSSSSGGPLVFPSIPSQALVGPNGMVSMPYRPYFMSLPGGSSNVVPDGRKWGSQGLDLNAGPGGGVTDDKLPSALRQMPSQAVADEQIKMFQQMTAGSGVPKRKEPDGGWDGDRISYKHPSWQ